MIKFHKTYSGIAQNRSHEIEGASKLTVHQFDGVILSGEINFRDPLGGGSTFRAIVDNESARIALPDSAEPTYIVFEAEFTIRRNKVSEIQGTYTVYDESLLTKLVDGDRIQEGVIHLHADS